MKLDTSKNRAFCGEPGLTLAMGAEDGARRGQEGLVTPDATRGPLPRPSRAPL